LNYGKPAKQLYSPEEDTQLCACAVHKLKYIR
jgi:hypothetical protein